MIKKTYKINGVEVSYETGKVARQANTSLWVKYGNNVLLATMTYNPTPKANFNYVPLSTNYREREYARKAIPKTINKRETRQSVEEILISRLIDRSIRPLFPDTYRNETNVELFLYSKDRYKKIDVMAINAASLILTMSDLPYTVPIAAVRAAYLSDGIVINPTTEQLKRSKGDIVIAGNESGIVMLEGKCSEVSDENFMYLIEAGYEKILEILKINIEFIEQVNPKKKSELKIDKTVLNKLIKKYNPSFSKVYECKEIQQRDNELNSLIKNIYSENKKIDSLILGLALEKIQTQVMNDFILSGKRIDGRGFDEIREVSCERGILPTPSGSALFTRGDTQSLASVTSVLSNKNIINKKDKSFILHYNFPSFSVGDYFVRKNVSRREEGHGALAGKALYPVIPPLKKFPNTLRVVSEILESNGSSSMATVCSGSIALKDAGVPISNLVAGISVGLLNINNENILISDIQGLEDHFGLMDFKVTRTYEGITAVQLDIKSNGIPVEVLKNALEQGKNNTFLILDDMIRLFV